MSRDIAVPGTDFLRENTNGLVNVTGTAITVHAWINVDSTAAERKITGRWGTTNGTRQFLVTISATAKLSGFIHDGTNQDGAVGGTNVSTGVWHPVAMRKNGTGVQSLQVWLDGAMDGSTTSNRSAQSIGNVAGSQFRVGLGSDSSNGFDGKIAEVAIWLAVLTDEELVALSKGVPPTLIRPASIYHYWNLWGSSPEADLAASAVNLVVVGTPPIADHAPVGCPFPVAA